MAYCTDQYALGAQLSSEAAALAQQQQDQLGLANAYRTTAAIAKVKGELSTSIPQYELAIAAYRAIGNGQGTIWSLLGLSTCAGALGDYATAIARAQDVITLCKQIGFRLAEGWTLYGLGYLYLQQCNYPAAVAQFTEALQVGREIYDRRQQASVLNWLGTCLRSQGDLAGAVAYYDQALAIYREIGNVLGEGLALNDLAIVAREQGNYPLGQELCQQALKIGQEIGNQELQRRTLYNLGHLYSDQERYFQAVAAYEQALEKTARTQPLQRLHPLSGLAYIATQTGDVERAKALVDEVMAIIEIRKIDGTDEPMRILWNVQRTLKAIGSPYLSRLQSLVPHLLQHLPADPTLTARSA